MIQKKRLVIHINKLNEPTSKVKPEKSAELRLSHQSNVIVSSKQNSNRCHDVKILAYSFIKSLASLGFNS